MSSPEQGSGAEQTLTRIEQPGYEEISEPADAEWTEPNIFRGLE